MIFKIVSRADGSALGRYLLSRKNDQVSVLELRGTVPNQSTPQDLVAALKDFDEFAKMTKGEKTIVHLAINPNDQDRLSRQDWQHAIDKAETAFGLQGQPRAIVSHVYKGKEHMHVAWTRVQVDRAVCLPMPHSKYKAVQAAREVELELGLHQTIDRRNNPSNQRKKDQELVNALNHQKERARNTDTDRSAVISKAWHQSKDGQSFKTRVEEAGYHLAIGNRGVVVMDQNLEPFSIPRCVKGVAIQDVREKLSQLKDLPTVENVRNPARALLSHNRARHMIRDELKYQISNDREHKQQNAERGPEL